MLELLSLDISGLRGESLFLALKSITAVFTGLEVAIDAKAEDGSYKFLDALLKANANIRKAIIKSADLKDSDFMTKIISGLIESAKQEGNHLDVNQKFIFELIDRGSAKQGTEDEILNAINPSLIKEAITRVIAPWSHEEFRISDSLFKKLSDVYFAKANEKDKSSIFRFAIENIKKRPENKAVVMDMVLHGYKLDKSDIYTFNTHASSDVSKLGKEILDNKSFFSSSSTELTDNDAKRVAILSSALANGYFKSNDDQAKYVRAHRGISPLKLAIDTKQFDLATEMIKKGEILKPEELSIGMRFKNAIGVLKKDDLTAFSKAKLDVARKEHSISEKKFQSKVKSECDRSTYSRGC